MLVRADNDSEVIQLQKLPREKKQMVTKVADDF